ncbi:hypothetical protein HMI56_005813, partial [Coelomomyces lativittatus]
FVTFYKNFFCTNETVKAQLGDTVRINTIPRINETTYFKVSDILMEGKRYTDPVTNQTITYLPKGYYPSKPGPKKQSKNSRSVYV